VSPNFPVVGWMQNGVMYQIFPDRFRNGTPDNDPKPTDFRYDYPAPANATPQQIQAAANAQILRCHRTECCSKQHRQKSARSVSQYTNEGVRDVWIHSPNPDCRPSRATHCRRWRRVESSTATVGSTPMSNPAALTQAAAGLFP